ncbi:Fur2 [Symbiodinium natans]|uniref:Fur2 protein n=1 Tax=Symbiodinium natans TaxID=878477 RepID=A0A812RDC6_9DINO|nr:Fur2 [Symbiodinium natans]
MLHSTFSDPVLQDLLFVGGEIGTLQAFRGSDLAIVLGGNVGSRVTSVTYDHDNGEVIAGGLNGRVVFMQVSTLQSIATVDENLGGSQVNSVAFLSYSDDVSVYSEVASCSYFNSNIRLWSMSSKTVTRELLGHSNVVLALKPLDGLQMLSSGSIDGFLGLWSLPLARLQADGRICSGSTFVPLPTAYLLEDCIAAALQQASPGGGDFFVYGQIGSTSANECQMLQNVGTCNVLIAAPYTMYQFELPRKHLFKAHDGAIRSIESIPEQGGLVASAGDDGAIHTWSPDTGLKVRDFGSGQSALNHGINSIAYSSTLGALVAATLHQLAFFDTSTGELLTMISRSAASPALSLSMDAQKLMFGPSLRVVRMVPFQLQRVNVIPAQLAVPELVDSVTRFAELAAGVLELPASFVVRAKQEMDKVAQTVHQDQAGQVNCKQCPRGSAQPNSRQTSCIACGDNSAAPIAGSELCQECPDGTEPSADHSDCLTCSQGTAGQSGVCNQCQDGQQNSPDFTICIPCPTGMFGTNGFCSQCPDGMQPDSARSACISCSHGFAGTAGVCNLCPAGEEPDAAAAICLACPTGKAGLNGSCITCPVGMVPSVNRSVCIFCLDGQVAQNGYCQICPDGKLVAENRSACLDCPDGYAGTGGLCDLCPEGTGASADRSFCEDCAEGYFGSAGSCNLCPNGTRPVLGQNSSCIPCPPTTAGTLGVCMQCPDGTQQNSERTSCESCPIGTAGTGGICNVCTYPLMQDGARTSCTEQSGPRILYGASRCIEHSCRDHFQEADLLYCCPTPRGFPLACCDSQVRVHRMEPGVVKPSQACLHLNRVQAAVAMLAQVLTCLYICWVWRSESWADWREKLTTSFPGAAAALICLCLHSIALPWILGVGMVVLVPSVALSILAFAGMHRAACRASSGIEPMARSRTAKKARAIIYFCGTAVVTILTLLGDWMIVHFLLVQISDTLNA